MVWDLPVPGGPMSTKLLPSAAARMADSWEESADMGTKVSATGATRSSSEGGWNSTPSS